ncbi:MAG: ATP-dependent DNA ligase [Candidatus Omnitrophota bacterium]
MNFFDLCTYFERLESTSSRLNMMEILAELFKGLDDKQEVDKIIYLSQGRLSPAFENIEFGMSEKLIARAIIEISGKDKKEVLKIFQHLGDQGLTIEKLIFHKSGSLKVSEVYARLEEIARVSGEGAVAGKIDGVVKLLKMSSSLEAKYIVRIILGRLRLGVGDPTILDSLSCAYTGTKSIRVDLERSYNLCSDLGLVAKTLFIKGKTAIDKFKVDVGRPIRVALAERLSSPVEIIEKIGRCAVEGKYDGFRCQVHKDETQVKIFSRNLEDNTGMFPEITESMGRQIQEKRVILEGEAICQDLDTGEFLPFQITVQRKRKYGISDMRRIYPLSLLVFDLLYVDGVDFTKESYTERRKKLKQMIKKGDVLQVAEAAIVERAEELEKFFDEAISKGLEGIVAKRLDAPYQAGGRNYTWIKLKRSYQAKLTDTIDCVLVGYLIGKGQRARLGLGSVLAAVYDQKEDRFKTIAKIGTGFSEEESMQLKKLMDDFKLNDKPKELDSLIDMDVWVEPKYVVEIQADEISKSPVHTCGKIKDGTGYALRFPRMVSFIRKDKTPYDATSVREIIKMYKGQKIKK